MSADEPITTLIDSSLAMWRSEISLMCNTLLERVTFSGSLPKNSKKKINLEMKKKAIDNQKVSFYCNSDLNVAKKKKLTSKKSASLVHCKQVMTTAAGMVVTFCSLCIFYLLYAARTSVSCMAGSSERGRPWWEGGSSLSRGDSSGDSSHCSPLQSYSPFS